MLRDDGTVITGLSNILVLVPEKMFQDPESQQVLQDWMKERQELRYFISSPFFFRGFGMLVQTYKLATLLLAH